MKKQNIRTIVFSIIITATILFIFSNSMKSIPESQEISLGFTAFLRPFLGFFIGIENVTDHLVRKMGHFLEFGLLGVELSHLLLIRKKIRLRNLPYIVLPALLIALLDETVQIFYERGSQVQDVWLDFAGAMTGILGTLMFYCGITRWKNAAKRRRSN